MNQDEALRMLRNGSEGVAEWNKLRKAREDVPSLAEANLANALLVDADLSGVDLQRAVLAGAVLKGATLTRAVLANAYLDNANFAGAAMDWVDLSGCKAVKANFKGASLTHAVLSGADLSGATFEGANAPGAHFDKAVLTGTTFAQAKLDAADFSKAAGIGTIFSQAELGSADMTGARLPKGYFGATQLANAKLVEADLTKATFDDAKMVRADLCRAVMREASFSGSGTLLIEANLSEADMTGADCTSANLSKASLQGATLRGADLRDSDLLDAVLRNADIRDANLSTARGLTAGQLGGANVAGAKLPDAVEQSEGLEHVAEASKYAHRLFAMIVVACIYCFLTIATTTDARLVTNSASSPLPVIGTAIPIVGFYIAAPLILLALYMYFHVYLQRLWEAIGGLPAVFTDGRPLYERAYPWLLIGIVCTYSVWLRARPRRLGNLQTWLGKFLAWWLVPTIFLAFWMRYLARHDWTVTSLHIVLLAAVFWWGGVVSYRGAIRTLRGVAFAGSTLSRRQKLLRICAHCAILALIGFIFGGLSYGAIEGQLDARPPQRGDLEAPRDVPHVSTPRTWIPWSLSLVGCRPFADLQEADLSVKPANWKGVDEQLALVKGARLRGADLRYARAWGAFLVNSDLTNADLSWACLNRTDLRNAELRGAVLRNASLGRADLRGASLYYTDLTAAHLWFADLSKTTAWQADFRGACLDRANLQGAVLQMCDFEGATFKSANFAEADLAGANMAGVDLRRADLRDIEKWKEITSLAGANIHGIRNPPSGFAEWATGTKGAVAIPSDEAWDQFRGTTTAPASAPVQAAQSRPYSP